MRPVVFQARDPVAERIEVLPGRARLRIHGERMLHAALEFEVARLEVHQMMRVRDVAAVLVHRCMTHRVAPHADTARRSNSTCEKCCEVSWSESSARGRIQIRQSLREAAPRRARHVEIAAQVRDLQREELLDRFVEGLLRLRAEGLRHFEEQRVDGLPLEGERAGIALLVDQEVDGGLPHRCGAIARSIGDGAVADFEQPFEFAP